MPEEALEIQSELIFVKMAWCTYPRMKLWYTNNSPYTILSPLTATPEAILPVKLFFLLKPQNSEL